MKLSSSAKWFVGLYALSVMALVIYSVLEHLILKALMH
jgi:hypothetical protein